MNCTSHQRDSPWPLGKVFNEDGEVNAVYVFVIGGIAELMDLRLRGRQLTLAYVGKKGRR